MVIRAFRRMGILLYHIIMSSKQDDVGVCFLRFVVWIITRIKQTSDVTPRTPVSPHKLGNFQICRYEVNLQQDEIKLSGNLDLVLSRKNVLFQICVTKLR